ERRFRSGQAPAEPHLGIADVIEVLEPQVVGPTGLEIHERALACDARRELPTVEHELAVDEQTEAVIRAHRKLVAARDRGHELSGPPNAEVVAAYRIRREFATRDQVVDRSAAIPTERHSPVDPRHHRRAGQILAL